MYRYPSSNSSAFRSSDYSTDQSMMPRQSQLSTNERSVYSHEQRNPSVMLVTRAPLYQIDFLAEDIGRRIASSKRKISW